MLVVLRSGEEEEAWSWFISWFYYFYDLCVMLDKFLNFSKPQRPQLWDGNADSAVRICVIRKAPRIPNCNFIGSRNNVWMDQHDQC